MQRCSRKVCFILTLISTNGLTLNKIRIVKRLDQGHFGELLRLKNQFLRELSNDPIVFQIAESILGCQ